MKNLFAKRDASKKLEFVRVFKMFMDILLIYPKTLQGNFYFPVWIKIP